MASNIIDFSDYNESDFNNSCVLNSSVIEILEDSKVGEEISDSSDDLIIIDNNGDNNVDVNGIKSLVNGDSNTINITSSPTTILIESEHENSKIGKESQTPKTPVIMPENPESKQIIDIKFNNRKTYLAFQEDFVGIIKKYYKNKLDDLDIIDDNKERRIRVSEKVVKKSDSFLIDTTPNYKNLDSNSNNESTPTYRNFVSRVLSDELEVDKEKSPQVGARGSCFNCDKSDHGLRDCPEPRNMRKINKARNEFRQKDQRYHDADSEKFGHVVPGKLSDELKSALGLRDGQIPLHVYRMRLFGYPMAWLEDAKIQNSGLSMFVDIGKKQLKPDEDEGEMDENNFKYDVQKIHDFPGFNVNTSEPINDLHYVYGVPPMLDCHSKTALIQNLGNDIVNGYKRRKLKDSVTVDVNSTAANECDMDLDSDTEVNEIPPQTSRQDVEEGEISDEDANSVDEGVLEEQKNKILAELSASSEIIMENSVNENRDNHTVESSNFGEVETTIPGCHVLPSFSGFSDLPQGDKFKEGVSDVIAFENLAESTGKFEKMRDLLKKVKDLQNKHQNE